MTRAPRLTTSTPGIVRWIQFSAWSLRNSATGHLLTELWRLAPRPSRRSRHGVTTWRVAEMLLSAQPSGRSRPAAATWFLGMTGRHQSDQRALETNVSQIQRGKVGDFV